MVRCGLKAMSGSAYKGLPGQLVRLVVKGVSKKNSAKSDANGLVKFSVRLAKGRSASARCTATVINPATNKSKVINSKMAALR